MRGTRLLVLAAIAYIVAAWSVAPGFYDGFVPPQPYNYVCPPPQAGANSQPSSGHLTIKVINGSSDPNSAFTDDGQLVIGFLPGAFDVTGKSSINVTVTPVSPCPQPSGLRFVTNTYLITADAPLVKSSNLVLRYSNLSQDPSYIYRAATVNGPWTKLAVPQQQAQLWTVSTQTDQLGYFAGGFPSSAISTSTTSSQEIVPIVVAVLIVAVLLAGVPLTVMRRRPAPAGRRRRDEDEDDDE